jgi:phospholipase/carboxylesterase
VSKITQTITIPTVSNEKVVLETPLDCEIEMSSEKIQRVVVALHGYGDNAKNFRSLAGEFSLPDTLWVVPHAPYNVPMAFDGGQWYPLLAEGRKELEHSAALIQTLCQRLIEKTGISPSKLVLLGFSQGGCLALYTWLRSPVMLGGVVCLSGYLNQTHRLPELAEYTKETPVLLCHGTQDSVVLPSMHYEAIDTLQYLGCRKLSTSTYPVGHSLYPREVDDVRKFIIQNT